MSKSSRNQPVVFPAESENLVIELPSGGFITTDIAESPVAASESPETPESGLEPFPEAPEAVSEAPSIYDDIAAVTNKYIEANKEFYLPTPVEPMSSQHDLAQHIAELLAEEGAEMATLEPPPSEKIDLEAELKEISTSGAIVLPDGSIKIPIIVPQEQVEILRAWADGAGEPFETYLQTIVELGLNAVITGGAVAG